MNQEDAIALVVSVLEGLRIPYMVAGSFASSLHGVPRMTNDADIVIDADEKAARQIVRRLESEFYASEDAALEAIRTRRQFNVIHYDSGFKVDLVVKKDRPFSDEELRRRRIGRLAGRDVPFATAEDTILTKLEWAQAGDSQRQYEDAVGIIEVSAPILDWAYLETWAREIGVDVLLRRAREGKPFR